MIQRTRNPNHKSYSRYGGRGITVCERWQHFANFLADMGERPEGTTLDRWPDNDGNYEPSNCRWATLEEQNANRSVNPVHQRAWNAQQERIPEVMRLRDEGWSQQSIARALGVSQQTVSNDVKRAATW